MELLNKRFSQLSDFEATRGETYTLLPFTFLHLSSDQYILTNMAGEYVVVDRANLEDLVFHRILQESALYNEFKSKHFLIDGDSSVGLELVAAKVRTKYSYLSAFTSLHIFVVSLRCDHSCPYCQVSRQSEDRAAFDMTVEAAEKALEHTFRSPSNSIKIEFQGGEPLLNFELIKYIVVRAEEINQVEGRKLQFVIATNLALLTDEHLDFADAHGMYFSTSLDGPEDLHNKNRPRPGKNAHQLVLEGIRRVRERLGKDRVSALMTTTQASLTRTKDIVDEYLRHGFHSLFLRSISPYGFAVKTGQAAAYDIDRWLDFYREGMDYIFSLNKQGVFIREEYASLLLRKMLTPFPTGYVDLQSPAACGIGVVVFNYEGSVYATDESRMLAEMGDNSFRLGNLSTDSYEDIFGSAKLKSLILSTMVEASPCCSDCGVVAFCGSDPLFHHRTQGDIIGYKPTSGFCRKNMEIIKYLIMLLEENGAEAQILRSWI